MEVSSTPTKKRILYVITKSNWGGAQRYVFDLATAAKAAGHDVRVVSGREGELTDRLRDADVPVSPIHAMQRDVKFGDDFAVFGELRRIIKEFRPDVVHGNSSKAGALVSIAGRFSSAKRVIFTAHGWAFNENRPLWQKCAIGLVHYVTVLLSDITICNSESTKRDIRWMPFVAHKLKVVHHGLDPVSFVSREEARRTLAPDATERLWVGTIAELHPVKGLDVLVKAIEHVLPDYTDLGLFVIGEGQERGYIEHLIKVEGVTARARLLGHVSQASRYLKAFDVFVLPSRSESLGYVLLEAGSAELPVVASEVGGIPEIVTDDVTGLLVPPGDQPALTEAIENLLRDSTYAKSLAEALKKKVDTEFTKERMVSETLALY